MTTKFTDEELDWLKAGKQAFVLEPVVKPFDQDLFLDKLKGVLAFVADKSRQDGLLDKINFMPTDEFWDLYLKDFA